MATQTPQDNALAVRRDTYNRIVAKIDSKKTQFSELLQNSLSTDRFTQTAKTALQKNPGLLNCTPQSIVNSILLGAELGLLINTPHQHAALIPYKTECTLQPMYKGLVLLAVRAGGIKRITAEVVYENDTIDVDLGMNRNITHKPAMTGARLDDKIIGTYAVYVLPDGEKDFCWMTRADIEAVRGSSRAEKDGKPGPWTTAFAEMCKKTVVKRALKLIPNSDDKTALALAADNAVEFTGSMAGVVEYDIDGEATEITGPPAETATARMKREIESERPTISAPADAPRRGRPPRSAQQPAPAAPAPAPHVSGNPFGESPAPAVPAPPGDDVDVDVDDELDLGPDPLAPAAPQEPIKAPTTPQTPETIATPEQAVKPAKTAPQQPQNVVTGELDEELVKRVMAGGEALGSKMYVRLLSEIGVGGIEELDNDGLKLLLKKMNNAAAAAKGATV